MYTCTYIIQLFVNYVLLFEALMEDWRVVKWVASWNKVFIIIFFFFFFFLLSKSVFTCNTTWNNYSCP